MNIVQMLGIKSGITVSFELLPPERGGHIDRVFDILDPLLKFEPLFISIANHQSEHNYLVDENGRSNKIRPDKRPSNLAFTYALQKRYNTNVLPHLLCNELTPFEIEDVLIGLQYIGVKNVMALRGDRRSQVNATAKPLLKYNYAREIVAQIKGLNRGSYLDETVTGFTSEFCIGVAGYPEKHPEAPSMYSDLCYLKEKVDAGADFIITQMFFNNQAFKTFVTQCRAKGIKQPILPGLKPITHKQNLALYKNRFGVSIPCNLEQALLLASNTKEETVIGKEWLLLQCEDLLWSGHNHLHFFIFSPHAAKVTYEVLNELI